MRIFIKAFIVFGFVSGSLLVGMQLGKESQVNRIIALETMHVRDSTLIVKLADSIQAYRHIPNNKFVPIDSLRNCSIGK